MPFSPCTHPSRWRWIRALLLSGVLWQSFLLAISGAQITLDGSLGSQGALSGPNYRIGAELGQLRGGNLFHSFGEFNVPTGGSATFTGPQTIANIVSRVTGGQLSSIDGLLRSEIAGANLFLLNPAGVLFGPNARLDVSGSFHVSTADFLRFADGTTFSAHLGQESVLTVAPPAAFGFLGSQPAPVTIQSSHLDVPAGRALSVVGGDVQIVGGELRAPGGRLQLASVGSPGEVRFSPLELAPDLHVDGFGRLGRLELLQNALLDASGDGGGTVLIRGGRIVVDHSRVLASTQGNGDGSPLGIDLFGAEEVVLMNRAVLQTGTQGAGRAGEIQLTGGRMQITDSAQVRSTADTSKETTGAGGHIILHVGNLTLSNDVMISSASGNAGRAGDVTIVATEGVSLIGPKAVVSSDANASGAAGRLFIAAPTVTMEEGQGTRLTSQATASSSGDAGDLVLQVGRLTLTGGVLISSGSDGTGRGGTLTIIATDAIAITGLDRDGQPNALRSGTTPPRPGSGSPQQIPNSAPPGRIVITAPSVRLTANAQIDARTRGSGDASEVLFQVGSLTLASGSTISVSSFGGGRGGDIIIQATEGVTIRGTAAMFSDSNGKGPGGRIFIAAPRLSLEGLQEGRFAARLQTRTGGGGSGNTGDAGNLVLEVGRLTLTGKATIESSTTGSGRGGNIRIVAREIQLHDEALITASSTGKGTAGMIRIQASETFRSQKGRVTTSSTQSGGGVIELRVGRLMELHDSQITTAVQGGGGDAGNLTIEAPFVVAEGSRIIANAFEGMGGNIRIRAKVFVADPGSQVEASSTLGISGMVDITGAVTGLTWSVAPLPQTFVHIAELLPVRCAARAPGGRYSSLVLSGREGLPLEPDGALPSPLALEARLAAVSIMPGAPPQPLSPAILALLAGHEKALPRLGCPQ
jgi:filamentous hemagglutinin family protein